jgi:Flp pilus assembly protein TadG
MWRKFRDNQRGAVLVEAAVVFPLLIMLTVGIWTTSRAWNIHNVLDHAAREGARHGATVDPWDGGSEAQTVIQQELSVSSVNPDNVATTIDQGNAPGCAGASTGVPDVEVCLTYSGYQLNFVFFSFPVTLDANAVARWEGD